MEFSDPYKTPRDGHCLLHLVAASTGMRIEKLKANITLYISKNASELSELCPDFQGMFLEYIKNRKWNNLCGNMLPYIIANTLSMLIIVLKEENGFITPFEIIPENCKDDNFSKQMKNTITLFLSNNHYQYFVNTNIETPSQTDNIPLEENSKNSQHMSNTQFTLKPTLVLPYTSEKTLHDIKKYKCTLQHGSHFNVVFKSKGKISMLVNQIYGNRPKKKLDQETDIGIIYEAKCMICQNKGISANYIGETSRTLEERISEHMRKLDPATLDFFASSSISLHAVNVHAKQPAKDDWAFTALISNVSSTQNRKTLEAVLIHQKKPNLNKDNGVYFISSKLL